MTLRSFRVHYFGFIFPSTTSDTQRRPNKDLPRMCLSRDGKLTFLSLVPHYRLAILKTVRGDWHWVKKQELLRGSQRWRFRKRHCGRTAREQFSSWLLEEDFRLHSFWVPALSRNRKEGRAQERSSTHFHEQWQAFKRLVYYFLQGWVPRIY